jgi:hypothetical protein
LEIGMAAHKRLTRSLVVYRRFLLVITILTGLVFALTAAGLPFYVFPPTDETSEVDAVFALGPISALTIEAAHEISRENGGVPILMSVPEAEARSKRLNVQCEEPGVVCRVAEPFTTSGEARLANGVSAKHGWKTIAIVANVGQVTRARYIFGRCYQGQVRVVSAGVPGTFLDWAERYAYQTAAFVKAINTACA